MDDKPACSLCLHRCDERWVGGMRAFCARCLVAIGGFVLHGPGRARFWPALQRDPTPVVPIGEAEPEPVYEYTAGGVFAEMAPSVVAEAQVDLAIAYREMGLEADALEAAALALQQEAKLSRPRALEALTFILGQQSDALIVGLREALFAN